MRGRAGEERWKIEERGRGDALVLYAIFESGDFFEWNIKIPLADVRSKLKRMGRGGGKGPIVPLCAENYAFACALIAALHSMLCIFLSLEEKSSSGLAR